MRIDSSTLPQHSAFKTVTTRRREANTANTHTFWEHTGRKQSVGAISRVVLTQFGWIAGPLWTGLHTRRTQRTANGGGSFLGFYLNLATRLDHLHPHYTEPGLIEVKIARTRAQTHTQEKVRTGSANIAIGNLPSSSRSSFSSMPSNKL